MANKRQKKAKPNDRLNYGDVSRELKAGGPARLYLLYGQEDYLREAFLGEIKAACLPDGGDDFSYHRLDGRSTSLRELSDAVTALPFLSERTLTEVRGYDFAHCRDAEAAALGLSGFADVSKSGDARPIIDGTIGRKYGFDWAMDQQVPSFEASVMTEGALTVNGANEAGAQVVSLAKATNAAGLKEGDILTIAGDAQTYVVTEAVSLAVGNTAVKIYPGLARATTGSEAVTVSGSHVMNLAFHRDAIAFATRPLMDSANGLGNLIQSAVDPVSGLSLRLEVSREHKRTRFSYDILYGADVVRRELGCRIAG